MVYIEEESDPDQYWNNASDKFDMKIKKFNDLKEENEDMVDLYNYTGSDSVEKSTGDLADDNQIFHKNLWDNSAEYEENNFDNENDVLRHFEDHYETEYLSKFENYNLFESKQIAENIKVWLKEMDKKLDFIYNYEMPTNDFFEPPIETLKNCICDPFTSLDAINEDSIEEILSMTSNKKLTKVQGKCLLRLKDGTDLIGSWQNGRRNGQGSFTGPFLDKLGVSKIAGNYSDGVLSGIGWIHMKDGSIREGWFCHARADGPFKGVVKVCLICNL